MSALLVTGCSTGFGRATALHFLRRGWCVIATVRKQQDVANLVDEAGPHATNLTVVVADITRKEDVASLAEATARTAPSLTALVNNAGTAFPAPLELLNIDDLRRQLEVNVVAQLAVTQAVLPYLKAARGTIVNVSSVSGRIASPLVGAYNMSKFALEAMSDVLRLELIPFGIRVAVIQPGSSPTAIWQTSEARQSEATARGDVTPYATLIERLRQFAANARTHGFPPQLFADTVERILNSPNPKPRYPIPGDISRQLIIRKLVTDRMWDRIMRRTLKW